VTPLLQATGLRKSFGSQLVLDGLDLEVDAGDCVVLIGGSGSGKSTLLRCLNLLETVDDGQILLEGTDISDPRADVDAVRSRIGIVFQAFNLFPHLSVLDNITLAPQRVHRVPRAEAQARAREMLARVGLSEKASMHPDQLSGGQQQRVAIARALVNRPALLLLDEVTSALDPELVGEVLALLRELREDGMTMVIATHEMSFARQVADSVCFLADGGVLESGPPEQVFGAPRAPRLRNFLAAMSLQAPLEPDDAAGQDPAGL
jgi:polar amino acid transport system ATP-binding protein